MMCEIEQTKRLDPGMLFCDVVSPASPVENEEIPMLYTIAVILLIAWLLGIVGVYAIGTFVHVLLVVAVVLFVAGLLSGRRAIG